jgi:hypothetical protein
MLPDDPNMLLSIVNLKLRDFYSDFEKMCDDMDVSMKETEDKLNEIGYYYDKGKNQFVYGSSKD